MTDATRAAVESRLAAGDAAGAEATATAALRDASLDAPARAALLRLRAHARQARGEFRAAVVDLEGAFALSPRDARLANELGVACADAGATDAAVAAFRRATEIEPSYARGWNNYGNALRAAGRAGAAAEAFAHAAAVDPAYALAWANLGAVRREAGDAAGADAALVRALELDPTQRVALMALAGLRREQARYDEAAAHYAKAASLDPRDANAALMLGGTLAERDDLAGARSAFTAALTRDPAMLRAAFGRELTLPMVCGSRADAAAARRGYTDGLARLAAELPARAARLDASRAMDELRWSNFLLAYQGEDDRALQEAYARNVHAVLEARAPRWLERPARRPTGGRRPRVGFLSSFFRDGTVGRYFERWIADLARERFDVVVYHLWPTIDALAERLRARADHFWHLPQWRPAQIAPRVRADALDVLVFPELGMDATTFGVASLRLAPRQCAGWGHPVTTGLPTIDTFFSCASMEPEAAASQYTEALTLLPGFGTRYAMPVAPVALPGREALGLPRTGALLLCPQSLFKIHPDDDALFARVLEAARDATLVLFEGGHPALTAKIAARLASACRDVGVDAAARIRFLAQRPHDDYLALSTHCDAMLDTSRWSGGNTTLDALACALPVVTLPGSFMRARQSAAMLRQAGMPELVARDADDYVRIAGELAREREMREAYATRLRAGRAGVFDDAAPIAAFADALDAIASG